MVADDYINHWSSHLPRRWVLGSIAVLEVVRRWREDQPRWLLGSGRHSRGLWEKIKNQRNKDLGGTAAPTATKIDFEPGAFSSWLNTGNWGHSQVLILHISKLHSSYKIELELGQTIVLSSSLYTCTTHIMLLYLWIYWYAIVNYII